MKQPASSSRMVWISKMQTLNNQANQSELGAGHKACVFYSNKDDERAHQVACDGNMQNPFQVSPGLFSFPGRLHRTQRPERKPLRTGQRELLRQYGYCANGIVLSQNVGGELLRSLAVLRRHRESIAKAPSCRPGGWPDHHTQYHPGCWIVSSGQHRDTPLSFSFSLTIRLIEDTSNLF